MPSFEDMGHENIDFTWSGDTVTKTFYNVYSQFMTGARTLLVHLGHLFKLLYLF